jgi:hypothetical protein
VGVGKRRAVSPDGRVWRVQKIRERPSLAKSRKEPFFWGTLGATVLLLAFFARLIYVDYSFFGSLYALVFGVPLLLWLIERAMHLLRPRIRAETDGPPAEALEWKTPHPLGTSRLIDRVVEAIESGRHDSEPRGLRLVALE